MSGLQELGETPPNSQEALRQSGALDNRINAIDRQFHDLRQTRMSGPQLHDATTTQSPRNPPTNQHEAVTASSNRITASTAMANIRANFDAVEGREVSAQTDQDNTALALQHAGNEVQAASNARRELLRVLGDQQAAERVFGTHEEGERQGVDYESPVGGVFNRASVRYRVAEEARRGERSERTEEREPANDRARQRPQEVGRRSGGSSEAGGTQFYFTPIAPIMPSQSLQPNLTRSQFYTMQNQNQGQFSGSPPHLSSGANNPLHSQRLPPFSGTSQHFTLQGNTTVQPQPNGQPMAQHPQCIENHEAQRERMIAEGSHYFSTYGPGRPNATPTMNPSTTTYPAVRPFIPQIMSHPIVNPHTTAPPGQFDGAHQRSTSFAMPDFSTIAPEAARMQDVASQAQRRIIRDIRARRLDTPPPTTPGRFDSNVSPLTSVPYDLDPLRATANRISRSEDGASDSSDARDRLRRRRNAIGETDDTRPPIRPSTTAEAVEAAIANFRVRRHAGLATAVDQLVEGDISAVEQAPRGLDRNDGRPEPRTTEEMMVNMECKICFAQLATVAVLPCGELILLMLLLFAIIWGLFTKIIKKGHCVMCKWCADQTVPSHKADRTKPATQVSCPICRKRVKQKVQLLLSLDFPQAHTLTSFPRKRQISLWDEAVLLTSIHSLSDPAFPFFYEKEVSNSFSNRHTNRGVAYCPRVGGWF